MKRCWFRVVSALVFFPFLHGPLLAQANRSPDRPPAKAASGLDLNGIWDLVPNAAAGQTADSHVRLLVFQLKNTLQFYNVEGLPLSKPGAQILTATQPLPASLPGSMMGMFRWANPKWRMQWWKVTIDLEDANHFRVLGVNRYERKQTRQVRELPCDLNSPQHMDGSEAFYRGNAYVLLNDMTTATCWFHVAAIEGHPIAQARYADSLLHGSGVAKNVDEARAWATKSAQQHNPYGEIELAQVNSTVQATNLVQAIQGGIQLYQANQWYRLYRLHDPEDAFRGDSTAPLEPAVPTVEKDNDYRFDLSGEFRVHLPAPRPATFAVVARQRQTDFQLIVVEPNTLYPPGESMFNAHYIGGRITGDLMDAPAHKGDGYRGFAWSKAELKIVNLNELELPGGLKLARTRGFAGANRRCDALQDRYLDPGRALGFAGVDFTLKNFGNTACWLYIAGIQGRPEAALALGLFYRLGIGVKKDDVQSFIWVRRAADADINEAEELLAEYYEQGIGTKKSLELAQVRRKQIKTRLDILKMQAAQDAQDQQENDKQAQSLIGLIGLLGIPMNPFKEDLIQEKMAEGKSRERATRLVELESQNDWFAQFIGDMISGRGYQPPPMPPEHK